MKTHLKFISQILLIYAILIEWTGLLGCVSIVPQPEPLKEALFRGSLQQVWMAAEKVVSQYPVIESNMDGGVLRTDYLRGDNCWRSPAQKNEYSFGTRCNLVIQFAKIPEKGIRVRINKTIELVRDFVANPEKMQSDGLEEMNLLYRIDRELTISSEIGQITK